MLNVLLFLGKEWLKIVLNLMTIYPVRLLISRVVNESQKGFKIKTFSLFIKSQKSKKSTITSRFKNIQIIFAKKHCESSDFQLQNFTLSRIERKFLKVSSE